MLTPSSSLSELLESLLISSFSFISSTKFTLDETAMFVYAFGNSSFRNVGKRGFMFRMWVSVVLVSESGRDLFSYSESFGFAFRNAKYRFERFYYRFLHFWFLCRWYFDWF